MTKMKKKVLVVFGTRPEAIKMAPLVHHLKQRPSDFDLRVCITAQHREMLDQVVRFFDVKVDYDLDSMKPNQGLFQLTATMLGKLEPVFTDFQPDYTFVHGDTTTTLVTGLAAFYAGSKVCHVEAGLRTHNKHSPFPEEMNRQLTSRLTDLHFAPTIEAKQNLLLENIPESHIFVTGNTVIDALFQSLEKVKSNPSAFIESFSKKLEDREVVLITGHRRENHGAGFLQICEALREIAVRNPAVQLVYPVHLNPNVQKPVFELLQGIANVFLIEPLDYPDFIWMMDRSKLIITDSGGVQEEAPSLGKPVLVMRDTTERPEAVEAGTVKLVGTDTAKIIEETERLLSDTEYYEKMSLAHNPYGDGKACERIIQVISG
jgi:UDP-N-acetylglucosamine 2-epimerase (non-hydrolysing)